MDNKRYKDMIITSFTDTNKAYYKEISLINDMLSSGYYAYNSKALNNMRSRKSKLYRRINNNTNVTCKILGLK
jgi:hypothetical protein